MDFVCNEIFKNSQSEIFDFVWIIDNSAECSKPFSSTLLGGLCFEIVVKNDYYRRAVHGSYTYVGLRNLEDKNVDIRALLFFEIQNIGGELYLKESMDCIFTGRYQEHFSVLFIRPSSGREVQGRMGNIYFRNNKMRIKGKIYFQCCRVDSSEVLRNQEKLSENIIQLQTDLKDLLQDKVYADVQFHIESGVIHAHKNILSSRSAVFKKMFEQNMKEKEANIVKITDIEKSVFEVFLIFLYTGSIQDKKLDLIMPLYSVADKYAVESLFKTCSKILVNYISDATVAPILKLADMHNDGTLKATAIDFISKNFVKVEATESWDTLLNSDPRLASFALKEVSVTAAKFIKNTSVKQSTAPPMI